MNKLRDDFCKETNTSMGLDNVYDYVEWLELKINKQAEDKQLKLCEVGVTLKEKETPTFWRWLHNEGYAIDNNYIFKDGKFYSFKTLELKYKKAIKDSL